LEASNTITERASYLFRRASNEDLLKGQSTEAMAAACVHAAARDLGTPFQVAHISDRSPVQKSTINNTFYKIVRELELPIAPPKPAEFVPRIASAVNLSVCIRERALDIIAQVVDAEEHVGQSPSGVAAAALYGAAQAEDQSITQSELADAAYVSVVTLSRQFQTVEKYI
jgi:transcription initiation factor TFIIB